MQNIQIFNNPEFGNVRTVEIESEPWFSGKDVAEALGYSNPRKAVLDHVDEEDKGVTKCDTLGGQQDMSIINESGLYSLVLSSKLPSAKKFKKWITSEVIPSIRRLGGYIVGQESLSDEELMAKALLVAKNKIAERDKLLEEKEQRIEQMRPKEIFADAVSVSDTAILIGELAKIIKQNGIDIGQNRLFEWMRRQGYLISRSGIDYNMPMQKSMDMGLFEIKERTLTNPDGSVRITKTVLVTGKGQQYFINKFLYSKGKEQTQ